MKEETRAKSAQEIWDTALGALQVQVSKANYETWLQQTTGISYHDDRFVIGVPSIFVAEYLEHNQRSLIERTLTRCLQSDVGVEFLVEGGKKPPATGRRRVFPAAGQMALPGFNPRYTFDSFVVGDSNRLAHAAAREVAENPGRSFNPLFIYGGAGLGKTHLLHAIGHVAQDLERQALYASAEQFTNEFVRAIRQKNTDDFHSKYRSVDILLIDDIQFIGGKEQTEESFFHTFNELHNANHQIVITSDSPPRGLPTLQSRLRSRLEWGLTVDLQLPDTRECQAILQAKTATAGLEFPPEVMTLICREGTGSIREIEGRLNRVAAYCRLVQSPPTLEVCARALRDIAADTPGQRSTPTPRQLIQAVASSFNVTTDDLLDKKRDKLTVLARQVAMYLLRQETAYPLARIGDELGGRDHSTVIHACGKVAKCLAESPTLRRKIEAIQRELGCK